MGSVYRCHNREAKRILAAVKVLDQSLQRVPHAKARFIREAEILFELDHPHIVKVRNVRMDLATPYIEMEFVDGESLEDRIRSGPMTPAEALPLFRQVADALVYLHARGIRHRDIKPSNLLVVGGHDVKLVDFGIATEADAATLTERGQTFGSVPYAPPEWLDPEHLDPVRWDIYSAGVVFHELLTGRPAFPMGGQGTQKQWVVHVMAAKQNHPPLDPGPNLPVKLRRLIRDMTRASWQERLEDVRLVRDRLAEVDLDEIEPGLRFPEDDAPRASAPTWYPELPAARGRTMVPDDESTVEDPVPATRAAPTMPPPPPVSPAPATEPASSRGLVLAVAGAAVVGVVALAAGGLWWATRPPPPPPTRDVEVVVSGLPADVPVALTLAGRPPAHSEGFRHVFPGVSPGAVAVHAQVGADCPAACVTSEQSLTVEAGEGAQVLAIALSAPPPRVADPPPAPPAATPKAAAVAPSKSATTQPTVPRATRAVTVDEFARWLAKHPEWQHDAAVEAGKADGAYLKGWDGATPPASAGGRAMVHVSWSAAQAYCAAGHGGLAALDAAPLTWTESGSQPWHEYRRDGDHPAWRRSDGGTSTSVKTSESAAMIGFRCAR